MAKARVAKARVTTTTATGTARWMLAALMVLGATACVGGSEPAAAPHGPVPPSGPGAAQPATVARIVDGDTIWVAVQQAGGPLPADAVHRIRLLAYDAPEDTTTTQCGGPEATAALRRLIPVGSRVHLTADREDTDRYGRFLRYVRTGDGTFVNVAMVRRGHGHTVVHPPNDAHLTAMRRAERAAQRAQRGVWGPPCAWDGG